MPGLWEILPGLWEILPGLWESLPGLWESYDRSIAGGMFAHDWVYGVVTGRQQAA